MEESLIVFVFATIALAVLLTCTVFLPAAAIWQGRQIRSLRRRLDRIESLLSADRAETAGPAVPSGLIEPAEEPPPEPAGLAVAPVLQVVAPASGEVVEAEAVEEGAAETIEAWLGRRALGWVAVVLLLFAVAFFLKQVFENRWIGELGRVALGVLAGLGLCGLGFHHHRRGWQRFGQMLTAGGVVLLYLATFAAFGYYHLLPQQHAGVFLVVLVAETATLAVLYEAPAIALMAVVGALLTPLLLHTDRDQYRSLFLYLLAVNAGVVGLAAFRPWRMVGTLSLLGTQGLFWAWYSENYHPEKLAAAMGFQVGMFVLMLGYGLAAHVLRSRKADLEDLARTLLNAALFFAAAYVLLDEDYHVWMGTLALATAIVYAVLGWVALVRRPDDDRQLLAAVAVAMGFVATAIPLQADAAWIALGWAIEGLALWWFGMRARAGALRGLGAAFLALAVIRLVVVDSPGTAREPFVPLLNAFGLPALAVAACLLAAGALAWPRLGRLNAADRLGAALGGLGGIVLVWFLFSVETYQYFMAQIHERTFTAGQYGPGVMTETGVLLSNVVAEDVARLRHFAQMALSVVWALYAAIILAVGFRLRAGMIRWMALALFGVTLGKVVLVDMADLPGFYRVGVFLVAAVMMALAARAYQRFQTARRGPPTEVIEP